MKKIIVRAPMTENIPDNAKFLGMEISRLGKHPWFFFLVDVDNDQVKNTDLFKDSELQ